ncbi:hypothetical protein SGGMMB4_03703 [Sodalis glossinidius str. 'morsitans']|uniref:Uncharacterized protein n=1 Tax=Sodalis glossinidius (strain morsitans) TaxID=343509 RepID=A0A193QKK2_SODGM|nr:hypothetical protein SGGMMB4_03703 [Sodalis glossinidius str. 'morsitans']
MLNMAGCISWPRSKPRVATPPSFSLLATNKQGAVAKRRPLCHLATAACFTAAAYPARAAPLTTVA